MKRKERDEISIENVFQQNKTKWPYLKNFNFLKVLKRILGLSLQQSISPQSTAYQGLMKTVMLLIDHEDIFEIAEILEIATENNETEDIEFVLNLF